MSSNHIDIFLTSKDQVGVHEGARGHVISLGETVKVHFVSERFNIEYFMDTLNQAFEQALSRKENKNVGKTAKGANEAGKGKT